MPLDTYESSIELARPVYLYAFTLGEKAWRYASSAQDVLTLDGLVWAACAISHDGVKQTGDVNVDALNIEAPITVAPAQIYLTNPPSSKITLHIFQKDVSDPEVYAIYAGEVSQVGIPQPGKATITCETISISLRREGLRFGWQRSCPYALYDSLTCKVNKSTYAVDVIVTAVSGYTITVDTPLDAGIYPGGFLQWYDPVKGIEYLPIESQSGDVLTIFGTPIEMYVGLPITLYRGCARTPAACNSFDNYANYGGIPNMPGASPFDGNNPFY